MGNSQAPLGAICTCSKQLLTLLNHGCQTPAAPCQIQILLRNYKMKNSVLITKCPSLEKSHMPCPFEGTQRGGGLETTQTPNNDPCAVYEISICHVCNGAK